MTQGTSLDFLLKDLLKSTYLLEKSLLDNESEPEEWIELLNQRQEIMDSLSILFSQGVSLTDAQKKSFLQPIHEVDLTIVPMIHRKKKVLEFEMINMNKSKAVNQQYGDFGHSYSPYGAFFDKKK